MQERVLNILCLNRLVYWGMLFYEVLDWYLLFCCLFLVIWPCYPWFLDETGDICTYILDPHPDNAVYLFTIYFYPLLLAYSSSDEEVRQTIVTFELNFYFRVDSMVNIYTSFFLNFSRCTSLRSLMLIPLPFWEPILAPHLNYKHFRLLPIKYDRPANRFILL